VRAAAQQAIARALENGVCERRGSFLWWSNGELSKVRAPNPEDPRTRRSIEEIAPEEIDMTLAHLREATAGASDDELVVQVARVLGFDRAGAKIRAAVGDRIAATAAAG
jgi:hypothetical protein